MSDCPFCNLEPPNNAPGSTPPVTPPATPPGGGKRPIGLLRWAGQLIQWLFTTTILMLIPKCPMCIVAYVAVGTGLGISVSSATYLRIGLIVSCVAALLYLAARQVRTIFGSTRRARVAKAGWRTIRFASDHRGNG